MITPVLRMYKGKAPHGIETGTGESRLLVGPPACLLLTALILGAVMPAWFSRALDLAASLGFRP